MAYAGRGRGRGHGRGRARGRRRGAGLSRGHRSHQPRDAFRTSRLQDAEDAVDSEDEIVSHTSEESDHERDVNSSENDSDVADLVTPERSYTSLLQALKANTSVREPPHKKRKVEHSGASRKNSSSTRQENVPAEETREDELEIADAGLEEVVEDDDQHDLQNAGHDVDSDDDDVILQDPFETHYARVHESTMSQAISAVKEKKKQQQRQVEIGDGLRKSVSTFLDQPEKQPPLQNVKDLRLKQRLFPSGAQILKKLSPEEKNVAGEIFHYRDVQYGQRTAANSERLRRVTCLHALNHVFKTRDRILKNNAKAAQQDEESSTNLRDQGFTRPKVLFIVPTKQACAKFVDSIAQISESDQQENKARFLDTFSREDDESWHNKPEDFQELFGGNNEEDFRVGLKFTRKTIKYFSGFYNSDMIFSSALGLMRTITSGGGTSKSKESKKKSHDADFLSSIEVVVVDHAAAIQMQNWQHLDYIFTQLNNLPKDSHGCDFGRVRNWYLDGHASYLRQTILFTSYHTPEINSLFTQHARNIQGLARYTSTYAGAMLDIPLTLPYTPVQTFLRIDSNKNIATPDLDSNIRFTYFTTTIVPQLVRSSQKSSSSGLLIVIPTYADFTRLRNFLSTSTTTTSLSFGSISEYTPVRDVARSRSHFMNGRHSVLLYTERAHHHFRYHLKGVKKILFYGVPENPTFWPEFLAMLADRNPSDNGNSNDNISGDRKGKGAVRALFSKWDALKLERIVGTERIGRMLGDRSVAGGSSAGGGDMFEFV